MAQWVKDLALSLLIQPPHGAGLLAHQPFPTGVSLPPAPTHAWLCPLPGATPRPSPMTGGTPGRVGRTYRVLPAARAQRLLLCLERETGSHHPWASEHPLGPGPCQVEVAPGYDNPDTSSGGGEAEREGVGALAGGWGLLMEKPHLPGWAPTPARLHPPQEAVSFCSSPLGTKDTHTPTTIPLALPGINPPPHPTASTAPRLSSRLLKMG